MLRTGTWKNNQQEKKRKKNLMCVSIETCRDNQDDPKSHAEKRKLPLDFKILLREHNYVVGFRPPLRRVGCRALGLWRYTETH